MSTLDLQGESLPEALARGRRERVMHIFTVPASLTKYGVTELGIVELNAEEELAASKRAAGDQMRVGFELAKESIRSVNGKECNTNDGTADRAWSTMHPKVRMLCIAAYSDVHQPDATDRAAFMQSRQVQVG
jgi:hypothetical protein